MSFLDLIEPQPGKEKQARATQNKPPSPSQNRLPPTLSKLPPPPPKSTLLLRTEPSDPKRKRESKGKEVMEAEKSRLTPKEEAQRVAKQQKVGHRGPEKKVESLLEPQAWLPTPMLNEAPLTNTASIRDFQGGTDNHVANALETTLLLPLDMVRFPIHSFFFFFFFFSLCSMFTLYLFYGQQLQQATGGREEQVGYSCRSL